MKIPIPPIMSCAGKCPHSNGSNMAIGVLPAMRTLTRFCGTGALDGKSSMWPPGRSWAWPKSPRASSLSMISSSIPCWNLSHRFIRGCAGLVNRAFLSRQVERLRPKIESLSNQLIDGFEAKGEVDLLPSYATPIPIIVICELLGVPIKMADQLLSWSHDMVAMYMARRDRAVEDAAVAATVAFSDYMRGLVKERRKDLNDDLLSALIRAETEGQKLSENELITTAILILNAGHEATVHAIGNGVKTLLELGVKEPISESLIEEILRFDAPLHLFTRYALEDMEYAGIKLKKGEEVGLMLGAANRDPARFADPDHFNPAREPNPHVSFGAGIHFCIGAPLARLEMLIAFQTLFKRLPKLALAATPHYKDSYHFHGLEELRVRF